MVSWAKIEVKVFENILDKTIRSVHARDEDIKLLESFT